MCLSPGGFFGKQSPRGWPVELQCGVGFGVVALGTALAATLFPAGDDTAGLLVLAAVCGLFAVVIANLRASGFTAVLGWLFLNGFVVHHHGTLGWDGRKDVVRFAVLLAAAAAGWVAGLLHGRRGASPSWFRQGNYAAPELAGQDATPRDLLAGHSPKPNGCVKSVERVLMFRGKAAP